MRTAIICGALALAVTMASTAEDMNSANFMMRHCKILQPSAGSLEHFYSGRCLGTLSTMMFVLRMMRAAEVKGEARPGLYCANIPESVTSEEAAKVLARFIEARPQRMHEPFQGLAIEAMINAWPCKR